MVPDDHLILMTGIQAECVLTILNKTGDPAKNQWPTNQQKKLVLIDNHILLATSHLRDTTTMYFSCYNPDTFYR